MIETGRSSSEMFLSYSCLGKGLESFYSMSLSEARQEPPPAAAAGLFDKSDLELFKARFLILRFMIAESFCSGIVLSAHGSMG